MTKYTWIITKDHIAATGAPEGTNNNAVGVMGPRGCVVMSVEKFLESTEHEGGEYFKMYDDDGELYYEGLIIGDYGCFEPLDDFGMPNAGCTEIHYRNKETGEFECI